MAFVSRLSRLIWVTARFPALAILGICAPVIGFVLSGIALLALVSAGVWALEAPFRLAPALGLVACAVGSVALQGVYRLLLRVLSA
jgi:hypothetical protein